MGQLPRITAAEVRLAVEPHTFACSLAGWMDDIARFRKEAEGARQQAEKAISPLDKEAWLKVASEWIKLAQNAEKREIG